MTDRNDDVVIGEFIARYEEAAEGVSMDYETAELLARELKHLTAALAEANARADRAETARGEDGRLMSELTAERARADQMRKALQNIAAEAERENGGWVHLKRSIAINARAALATPPDPDKRAAALSDLAALDGQSL